ncbi:MAG: PDZ domain-containing protein [Chloroflexi bacterium OHK40]
MITYTISMPAPHSHLFHVTIEVDGIDGESIEFILPSWTPGSYMIREYARHVQGFGAWADGAGELPWRKRAKDAWCVEIGAARQVVVSYQVYANDLTVRTSHLDGTHGYFNGASVFMYVADRSDEPLRLQVDAPEAWVVTTALDAADAAATGARPVSRPVPGVRRWSFQAENFDQLVDSPVECGTHRLLSFEVDGIPHRLAIWGRGNEDEARLRADTQRIVEVQRDFFGALPYRHYTFILHLTDGRGGGLEHRNSVTNQLDRWSFRPERSYERYLSLTSHELFHAWIVKRLRPAPLGPFNYRAENYTRLLWLMEGGTSYYDELLLVRAGLLKPERYLERLAEKIVALQSQPGRLLQSVEQSSFDAWIKLYRPDENSANSSISYYLKGALVCLLLDMELRARSGGSRSLDDLLRLLYARYPAEGPGIPEEGAVLAAAEELVGEQGSALRDFFRHYVAGTEELDYARGLATVGLEPRWHRRGPEAWLGMSLKRQGERTLVAAVRADGPAYAAGVYADDELLALDGWRVNEERLQARLAERAPGETVRLSLFRGDALLEVPVSLGSAPPDALQLTPVEAPDDGQRSAYRSWLGL